LPATGNLITYANSTAVTAFTLASLASSSNLLTGQESDLVDNTTTKYFDFLIAGKITTGTTPTAGIIGIYLVGISDDANWPDAFDGANSAETITSADIKNSICRPVIELVADTNSNRTYPFGPVSVASLFGGVLPKKFVVFCSHSTVAALNATAGNHAIWLTGISSSSGN
jgi:hypothetical protein